MKRTCASCLKTSQVRYIERTGAITQNVMAICDFDMHFTYASIDQPGSMHDTTVLYTAMHMDKATFPHPPKGKHFCLLQLMSYVQQLTCTILSIL